MENFRQQKLQRVKFGVYFPFLERHFPGKVRSVKMFYSSGEHGNCSVYHWRNRVCCNELWIYIYIPKNS